MKAAPMELCGWGNYPRQICTVWIPEQRRELMQVVANRARPSLIARGLGRAYGDSALNRDADVVLQTSFNRLLSFDESSGILECEAGVSLAEIIDVFLPRGWFIPTTPGTKFVTVG